MLAFKLLSHRKNPIVKPEELGVDACFNPGAVKFKNKIILLPRIHKDYQRIIFFDRKLKIKRYKFLNYKAEIIPLISKDGLKFKRYKKGIIKGETRDFKYGFEDVRIIPFLDYFILIGTGKIKPPFSANADRIAIYTTSDFENFDYRGIVDGFDSRNAVCFFNKKRTRGWIILRIYPNIHLEELETGVDQLLFPSKYKNAWERIYLNRNKNLLLTPSESWEKEKIGAGPPPLLTEKGWLLFYHGVGSFEKIKRGYFIGAALLDKENPKRIISKTKEPIYIPSHGWELGFKSFKVDVPGVIFPTGLIRKGTKLYLYCGAGDKYISLLTCDLKELLNFLLKKI